MRIPIGQSYEFSVRVLEESGFLPEDLHNMSSAVFGVYSVDDRSAEVFKVGTTAGTYGVIEADFTGKRITEVVTEVRNDATELIISSETTRDSVELTTVTESHSTDSVETYNGDGSFTDGVYNNDGTTTIVTTTIDDVASNAGIMRIKMNSAATGLLTEQRYAVEDGFASRLRYAGVLVVDIEGRASIVADIAKIDAINTPSL